MSGVTLRRELVGERVPQLRYPVGQPLEAAVVATPRLDHVEQQLLPFGVELDGAGCADGFEGADDRGERLEVANPVEELIACVPADRDRPVRGEDLHVVEAAGLVFGHRMERSR